jgi:dimeric dUTPase (all-alpha-NTP-PPase superfamily)
MKEYNDIYNRNKKLDDIFINKYINTENKYYEKNCLELIVELCELANESKCFKYWTIKKPDMNLVLEEFADCLLMVLYMFNTYDIDSVSTIDVDMSLNILEEFNVLIRMCTNLMSRDNINEMFLKEIFTRLIHIGSLLELNDNDIVEACYKKIIKNEERLNSDY